MRTVTLFISLICCYITSSAQLISTFAGTGTSGYNGDNIIATSAQLSYIGGITFDNTKNLFVCDVTNNRIRKVNDEEIITTFAGSGISGYYGDGGPAKLASINQPSDVKFDKFGNLYIADFFNNRIRKIDTAGIITTIAGNGGSGANGDNGPAILAEIGYPHKINFDARGNLYITQGNHHCIRKIDTTGIITTVAGNGTPGYNGDEILATTASLYFPAGIIIDLAGNIYFTELFGARIRKISTSGIISTIAGTGVNGYNGDGILATNTMVNNPCDIIFDMQGNIIFVDQLNNRIRKIDNLGIIHTLVGTGAAGYNGDEISPLLADLYYPTSIAYDLEGNLLIADDFNFRVRKVSFATTGISDTLHSLTKINVFPNPFSSQTTITFNPNQKNTTIRITDIIGNELQQFTFSGGQLTIEKGEMATGIYFVQVSDRKNNIIINKKIVITE